MVPIFRPRDRFKYSLALPLSLGGEDRAERCEFRAFYFCIQTSDTSWAVIG